MRREIISGIYIIKNIVTFKIYVGSSKDIYHRWSVHKRNLNKGKHISELLQKDWNMYGESNFVFEIVERDILSEDLFKKENYYINKFNSFNPSGYNVQTPYNDKTRTIRSETNKDSIQSLVARGESHWANIYTETQIKLLIEDLKMGKYSYINLSSKHNIRPNIVYGIVHHVCWTYLTEGIIFPEPPISTRSNVKLSENQVKEIIQLLLSGEPNTNIIKKYGVSNHTISDIRNHKTWKKLTDGLVFPECKKICMKESTYNYIMKIKDYVEDKHMSYSAIAKELNISPSYVYVLYKKYKKELKENKEVLLYA